MRVRELPGACLELTLSVPSAGIYGVGKAAIHPPALAVLSYTPEEATQTIAWVGKGIVYDTGGLSIKGKVRCPWVEVWGWRGCTVLAESAQKVSPRAHIGSWDQEAKLLGEAQRGSGEARELEGKMQWAFCRAQ